MLDILSSRKTLTGEVFWFGLKHDILSREKILSKDFDQGISFPRQTRTATESRVTTIACGERPRPSTTVTSARELMPTGFFATISILRLQLLATTSSHRNWDFHWSETGASGDSCSQTYYGPEPFSEVKALLIRTWIPQIYHFCVRLRIAMSATLWVLGRTE